MKKKQQQMTGKNPTMEKVAAKENQERKEKEKAKESPGARKGTRRGKKAFQEKNPQIKRRLN